LSVPGTEINTEYTAAVNCPNPINTPATAPVTTEVNIGTAWVWRVEVRIPPGHAGLTGLALVDSGAFIVPYANPGPAWLVGDDDLLEYPLDKQTGVNLAFWSYNTSTDYAHTFYCRVIYTPISAFTGGEVDISVPDLTAWLDEIGNTGE
jgi:hypothetical protein